MIIGVSRLVAVVPIAGVRKLGGAGSYGHSLPPLISQQWTPCPGASLPLAAVSLCTHIIRISVCVCVVHFSTRTVPKPLKSNVSKIVYLQWLACLPRR